MGLSKKNLYIIPNNIVSQWRDIFLKMYPSAKLLIVEPKTFISSKRGDVFTKIRDKDFDGIIIAYSCFEQIPMSAQFRVDEFREMLDRINKEAADTNKCTSGLKKEKERITKQLSEL